MKLVYFNTQHKAWCFNEGGKTHLLSEGASLYHVYFIIIPEIRDDILKRINLGVPRHDALHPYPHAFMGAQMLNHQTLFPKKNHLKEIQYSFERGYFHSIETQNPTHWAEHVLLTSDFKIFV